MDPFSMLFGDKYNYQSSNEYNNNSTDYSHQSDNEDLKIEEDDDDNNHDNYIERQEPTTTTSNGLCGDLLPTTLLGSGLPQLPLPMPPPRKLLHSSRVIADRMRHRLRKWLSQYYSTYATIKTIAQWVATLITLGIIIFFAVLGANTVVFGGPLNFTHPEPATADSLLAVPITTCRNTVQGKKFVTDDRGFVCARNDVDGLTGCCKKAEKRSFSCPTEYCNVTSHCCTSYEYCVSCCMGPSREQVRKAVLESTNDPILTSLKDDTFEYCRSACRTSSKSLFAQNKYRNDETKHCFGPNAPPLLNETSGELRLQRAKEEDMGTVVITPELDMNSYAVYQADSVARVARTSSSHKRLNAANGLRVVLLTALLFLLLLPLDLKPRKEKAI